MRRMKEKENENERERERERVGGMSILLRTYVYCQINIPSRVMHCTEYTCMYDSCLPVPIHVYMFTKIKG